MLSNRRISHRTRILKLDVSKAICILEIVVGFLADRATALNDILQRVDSKKGYHLVVGIGVGSRQRDFKLGLVERVAVIVDVKALIGFRAVRRNGSSVIFHGQLARRVNDGAFCISQVETSILNICTCHLRVS